MYRIAATITVLATLVGGGSSLYADFVEIKHVGTGAFWVPTRNVTPQEAAGGAPLDGDVFQWTVTTDEDILAIKDVRITHLSGQPLNELYQHSIGDASNAEPPSPVFFPIFPGLSADTWITTPGATLRLGANLPGDGLTTFGDLTNDGPQNDFLFAQLTVPDFTIGWFEGAFDIRSSAVRGRSSPSPSDCRSTSFPSPAR